MASASLALIVGKYAGHESPFFNGSLGARPSRKIKTLNIFELAHPAILL